MVVKLDVAAKAAPGTLGLEVATWAPEPRVELAQTVAARLVRVKVVAVVGCRAAEGKVEVGRAAKVVEPLAEAAARIGCGCRCHDTGHTEVARNDDWCSLHRIAWPAEVDEAEGAAVQSLAASQRCRSGRALGRNVADTTTGEYSWPHYRPSTPCATITPTPPICELHAPRELAALPGCRRPASVGASDRCGN